MSGPATPQGGPTTPHTPSSEPSRFTGAHTPDRFPVPSPGMAPPSTPQQQTTQESKSNSSQRFGGPSPQSGTSCNSSSGNSSSSNSGSSSGTTSNPSCSLNSSGGPKTPSADSRFPIPSPKTPGMCSGSTTPVGDISSRFPGASPLQTVTTEVNSMNSPRFSGSAGPTPTATPTPNSSSTTGSQSGNQLMGKMGGFSLSPGKINTMDIGGGDFNNPAAANLPLNPNCSTPSAIQSSAPGKVFDPISSMAQMSQQLTSGQAGTSPPISSATTPTLTSGPVGPMPVVPGGPMPGGMLDSSGAMMGMPPVSTSPGGMMGGNSIASPVGAGGPRGSSPGTLAMMSGPNVRMVGPGNMTRPTGNNPGMPGPFGGANVQVKPNAPNTIQYLPARPQNSSMGGPRGPPSLDFLPRFSNPGSIENKAGSPMFPNCSTPNSMCGSSVPMSMSGPCGPMNVPGGPMCTLSGPMCSLPGPMSGGPNGGSGGPVGGNMTTMSGPTSHFSMSGPGPMGGPNGPMSMGPNGPMSGPMSGMSGPMGPNGPMMGPNSHMAPGGPGPMMGPNGPMGMNPGMMMGGPMGPNGQMMGPRGGGPMMRGPSPASMMGSMGGEMYGMPGPNPNMSGAPGPGPSHPGQGQMMTTSGPMYGPKGSPVNMGIPGSIGGAPDAAQPLPPSMGQSGNFKNSALMGPTTADPTYAAQFHNFQQQLYATNTRGPMGPMNTHVGPPGPPHPGGPVGPGGPMSQGPGGPMVPQNFPFNAK